MNVKALDLFVVVAASASLRQAAQKLGMTPTALSRQIDALEHYFNAELIDRNASGMRLSEAGAILARRAPGLVNDLRATRALLDDLRGLQRGTVTVQAGGAMLAEFLVPVVTALHQRYPGIRFHIRESRVSDLFTALTDFAADLGVSIFTPETARGFVQWGCAVDHAVIVGADHPLVGGGPVSMAALTRHALALPDETYGVRRRLDRAAAEARTTLDPVFVTGSLVAQKELAIRGIAALVLPPICCRREIANGQLVAVPLSRGAAIETSIDLCVVPGRGMPFAARALHKALRQFLEEQGRIGL
ncbi:LysR family transcriptional regulator [Ameyamaea chiangmaiensis NBRC 103196]|uniref:LysR family transcriptional regulator n=2 Tax=Ameyamaea chiangmaiensis TaxID=442969 RepID=A0A850PIR0_9PROT|nr:LysR family transcriptional regulator [Ameyamaea chiangmaiensis]NVN41692.1 LysR family transcriptional regulator [Ameyamaea chiangmaiensis]GBQ65870.1 LysR family transcriptional regulator [Ameyamaea chiangmaiensis NBRC 103196]